METDSGTGDTAPPITARHSLDTPSFTGEAGGVRLGTLVAIRWMAVAGQAGCLLLVEILFGFEVRPGITLPVVMVSAALNLWLALTRNANLRLTDRQAAIQLAFDLVHLASLLFLTGGLANPFSVLMLAPTCVSASILGRRSTYFLILISVLSVSALAFTPFSLPWQGPPPDFSPLYLAGLWAALTFTLAFLALYMARVGREGRARARALAATQIALEREQRLAALGGLAAAAAHELGTPLGTILLAVRERLAETRRQKDAPADLITDLELIADETDRCRAILARLGEHRQAGPEHPFADSRLEALVREAAAPHEDRKVPIRYHASAGLQPVLNRTPEAIHAIRNIVENAVGYARDAVDIHLAWDDAYVSVAVDDDGPGFDPHVERHLGEPYVTTRQPSAGRDGGLGLGLFIAKTLLERTGADIRFGRAPTGGARVRIRWPRGLLPRTPDAAR